ncbi:SDR family NAD(P)-dependent oxidoreductase [Luteimonas sp. 50]|uniref:SDR family NAD(P)-dependent oxidoreductase n=1 Tax=Cognatiluteimonas sedimenti TaxID=2927791 RepID=A0ABT0A5S3_9GAMM|nr:SDR family NAD(P)-dependent oxidoreductase [Lysobacter sedimenti]MCJ0826322.1 SDR family NAD(P)-dependent oxidoreductase [Lysobacter sedimenti]
MSGKTDPEILSAYFATMRQFLATQSRVMSAFLGQAPAAVETEAPMVSLAAAFQAAALAPAAPQALVPVPVPVAASVPITTPAVAAPVAAAAPAEAAAAVAGHAEGPSRAALVDLLLGLVEEKTGYPRDMVGLEQNLEADLGIDSIKRIEIVGSLLQRLPSHHREALAGDRSRLNTQASLQGMLAVVEQAATAAVARTAADTAAAEAPAAAVASAVEVAPPRAVMRPRREPLPPQAARRLTPGHFVLTGDRLGVAAALATTLRARGIEVTLIEPALLADEATLLQWCAGFDAQAIAGIVHLAALGTPPLSQEAGPAQWRQALQDHEKSLFLLLRELWPRLAEDAHVVAASDLGGLFGRDGSAGDELRLVAGAVGAVKSLRAERSSLRVKAVDLEPGRTAAQLASELLDEIELDGGRIEVGYPDGQRTVFHTVAEDVVADPAREAALSELVVLATGGARGITAEVLRELARPGNTLVLTGRSTLPGQEPEDTASLPDAEALRLHYVAQVRSGAAKLTPGEIQRRVQGVLALREMRANLADLRAAGAAVEYHAIDVTDEDGVRGLVQDVVARHGRIDGIVHGAGVIEDKLLADKRSDSWSRVVETKVIGLLLLQKWVHPSRLKFLTVFSSVAGRYGNSGQSDYATANELMNRMCLALQARWGERVAVSALCWGPWGATKFGAGMVTADTEAKFAAQGVRLVSAALGRRLFREELARAAGTPVEVVCGEALWDSREAELGVIRQQAAAMDAAVATGPLIEGSQELAGPGGERILPLLLDPRRHRYLHEHVLDGKPVLPAAVALELMAEAARTLWPGWRVVEVREHKLLKGVELSGLALEGAARNLQVRIAPPPYGSSEGFDVVASLQSELGGGRAMTHYRCVVRLEQLLPPAARAERVFHDDKALAVAKAYDEWLFHGPRFQVIEDIDGLSPAGAGARVRSTQPAQWLDDAAADAPAWIFDPGLLDAAAQMAWLWSRAYRDESALPTRFGRVVRYRDRFPARLHMQYTRIPTDDPTLIRGNVLFLDEHGEAVMAIEELDSVASAALNRFGGTAREAAHVAA